MWNGLQSGKQIWLGTKGFFENIKVFLGFTGNIHVFKPIQCSNVTEMKLLQFCFEITFFFWSDLNSKMIEKCDTKTIKNALLSQAKLKSLKRIFVILLCWRETFFVLFYFFPFFIASATNSNVCTDLLKVTYVGSELFILI